MYKKDLNLPKVQSTFKTETMGCEQAYPTFAFLCHVSEHHQMYFEQFSWLVGCYTTLCGEPLISFL